MILLVFHKQPLNKFYSFMIWIDNLKAELRVFTNWLREKEHSDITAQGDDKGYKKLCNRRKLMAEDAGIQNVLPELCKLMKIF